MLNRKKTYPFKPNSRSGTRPRRSSKILFLILILVMVSLACVNSEISLRVTHTDEEGDSLYVKVRQYLSESYIKAAKQTNQERAEDLGLSETEKLLPESITDLEGDFLDLKTYREMGFEITTNNVGYTAEKTLPLDQKRGTESWSVKVTQNEEKPELFTYEAKVIIDLQGMEDLNLHEIRQQELPEKPDPGYGVDVEPSGDFMGDLFGLFSAAGEIAEQEINLEMWYIQSALKKSDPIEYRITVELPGVITSYTLDGQEAGELKGNVVTLVLDEETLMSYAGKKIVYKVVSHRLDCTKTCKEMNEDPNHALVVWDGKSDGTSCNCVCKKGWKTYKGEGEGADIICWHCDEWCEEKDENFERDLEKCEINECACKCKDPMVMNRTGTECIDEYGVWEEDIESDGLPSAFQLGEVMEDIFQSWNANELESFPGWWSLTRTEKERLLQFLEGLTINVDRTRLLPDPGEDPLPPDHECHGLGEEGRRLCLKAAREKAVLRAIQDRLVEKAEKKVRDQRRVHSEIIKAIGGRYNIAPYLLEIPKWYHRLKGSVRQVAEDTVKEYLTEKVKTGIKETILDDKPATIEEAAAKMIDEIPKLATKLCVDDYYQYRKLYDRYCPVETCSDLDAKDAHTRALAEIHDVIDLQRRIWAEPGGPYDKAFQKLNLVIVIGEDQ